MRTRRTTRPNNRSWSRYVRLSGIIRITMLTSVLVCSFECVGVAQTIRVDATPSHVLNKFSPPYALGTTVDRVPSNAADTFFAPDQMNRTLEAGWGVVSYRQKYRIVRSGMALESGRNMERFFRQRVFHWRFDAEGNDPAFLRIFVAASRVHAKRGNGI